MKKVADLMTANPIVVRPQTPLAKAIELLAKYKISGMPVTNDDRQLVGVISETDLMWQETGVESPPYIMFLDSVIYLQNLNRYEKEIHKALGQTVAEVMSDRAIDITPRRTAKEAAKLMLEKNIRRLPVVEPTTNFVIGILTRGDIVRAMADS
jgi:CBS domain-containing protein